MRFLAEDRIAFELSEMIKSDFDYSYSSGEVDFAYEVELDGEKLDISGCMEYESRYEEDVNYEYISYAYVNITHAAAYNDDGDEIKFNYNVNKIEEYIKKYLTE